MPQALLPLIPEGSTPINDIVSVVREGGTWSYFMGVMPVYQHAENDRKSFRLFTAMLVHQGSCKQVEITKTFGVSKNSVQRAVNLYAAGGIEAFFAKRKSRGSTVFTDEVIEKAQQLLDEGCSRREVATTLDIKYDTLRKTINLGRLREPPAPPTQHASDKSQRSSEDSSAEMGNACTRPGERMLAAMGMLEGAPTHFETCHDVALGGVLTALPALAENGLFSHLDDSLPSLSGYYTTLHVMTLLAYMGLCRIKTAEQLQYHPPGELGKLMGLDRVPEVRCLRNKLDKLSRDELPEKWASLLSREWMQATPKLTGTLYVDGHVRVYHGHQSKLPRRYVSRQRLCLRGTTDYWVNDALGQPFFVVERPVDHGILEAIRNDIVPQLLADVPNQPSDEQLKDDPYRARLIMIFDREGYSPVFFKEMWTKHRIACITYHKHPKDVWPEEEFSEREVKLPNGESLLLPLAERGSRIGDKKLGLWVREIRKLSKSGHQTSLISSAYGQLAIEDAGSLFSRWSQENFFGT